MSIVIAAPELIVDAATDLASIGSTVSAAHTAAATPTVAVIPAAADEVSASIAHLFSQHAQDYQALAGQAAAFGEQFVQHLTASARSYAATEAANAASLQHLNPGAATSASGIAAIQGQLVDLLNAIVSRISNLSNGFLNALAMGINIAFGSIVLLSLLLIAFILFDVLRFPIPSMGI